MSEDPGQKPFVAALASYQLETIPRSTGRQPSRFKWWYSSISDWMLANPGRPFTEASHVNGGPLVANPNTIAMIARSDLFRSYHALRCAEWRARHDQMALSGQYDVLHLTTELILEELEKKRTKVPLQDLMRLNEGALDRLGYGEKKGTSVHIDARQDNRQVHATISADLLAEAQDAVRTVEQMNRRSNPRPARVPSLLPSEFPGNAALPGEFADSGNLEEVPSDDVTRPAETK